MDFFKQIKESYTSMQKAVEDLWVDELNEHIYVDWKGKGDYALVDNCGNKLSEHGVYYSLTKIDASQIGRRRIGECSVHIGYFASANKEEMIRRLRLLLQAHKSKSIDQLRGCHDRWDTRLEHMKLTEVQSKRPCQSTVDFVRFDEKDVSTWPEVGEWVLVADEDWTGDDQFGPLVRANRFVADVNGPRFGNGDADGIYWAAVPKIRKV